VKHKMVIDVEKMLEEKASAINKLIERYIPRKHDKTSLIFSLTTTLKP